MADSNLSAKAREFVDWAVSTSYEELGSVLTAIASRRKLTDDRAASLLHAYVTARGMTPEAAASRLEHLQTKGVEGLTGTISHAERDYAAMMGMLKRLSGPATAPIELAVGGGAGVLTGAGGTSNSRKVKLSSMSRLLGRPANDLKVEAAKIRDLTSTAAPIAADLLHGYEFGTDMNEGQMKARLHTLQRLAADRVHGHVTPREKDYCAVYGPLRDFRAAVSERLRADVQLTPAAERALALAGPLCDITHKGKFIDGHRNAIYGSIGLPDGRLLNCYADGKMIIYNPQTGVESKRLDGHNTAIYWITKLHDGKYATCCADKTIKLWSVGVKESQGTIRASDREIIQSVATTEDGMIVAGHMDSRLTLWDPDTKALVRTIKKTSGKSVIAVVPLSGRRVAYGCNDQIVRVWHHGDDSENHYEKTICGDSEWYNFLSLTHDGKIAASGAKDSVYILDPDSLDVIQILEGHTGKICAVTLLRDGRLATGSRDNTVRIWDHLDDYKCCAVLEHDNTVYRLAALENGGISAALDMSGSGKYPCQIWGKRDDEGVAGAAAEGEGAAREANAGGGGGGLFGENDDW